MEACKQKLTAKSSTEHLHVDSVGSALPVEPHFILHTSHPNLSLQILPVPITLNSKFSSRKLVTDLKPNLWALINLIIERWERISCFCGTADFMVL